MRIWSYIFLLLICSFSWQCLQGAVNCATQRSAEMRVEIKDQHCQEKTSHCSKDQGTTKEQQHKHDGTDCEGTCSCICCGVVYFPALQEFELELPDRAPSSVPAFSSTLIRGFHPAIWQPPRA